MHFRLYTLVSLLALTFASPITQPSLDEPKAIRDSSLNSFLALLLQYLPAIDGPINVVSGILTTFEQFLATITGEQTTYEEASGSCKPYTVLFARGTTDAGNVGILVGPPFFEALREKIGGSNVAFQGVDDYSASVDDYLNGGDPVGSQHMATQILNIRTQCPSTKLVVSGYSQGGQIVHNAVGKLPADTITWISKIVIFGDPLSKTTIPTISSSRVKRYCHAGDNICEENGFFILPQHLTYGIDAVDAAAFVAS